VQVDTAFTLNDWYSTDNWVRDNNELYPHIKYTSPTSVYEIYSTNDFWKFGAYGSDPEAKFLVTYPGLINCSGKTITYPILKGAILGQYENSGFSNITAPLFKTITGTVQDLKFSKCSAPITNLAKDNASFTYLSYTDCEFKEIQHKQKANNNLAGIAYEVQPSGNLRFSNIVFNSCKLNSNYSEKALNAGLLFANTVSSGTGNVNVSYVSANNAELCEIAFEGSNIGGFFGNANVGVSLVNSAFSLDANKLQLQIKTEEPKDQQANTLDADGTIVTTNVGYVGGAASEYVELNSVSVTQGNLEITGSKKDIVNNTINIGGLIGCVNSLKLNVHEQSALNGKDYFDANINVAGLFNELNIGGLVGRVQEQFNYEISDKNLIVSSNSSVIQATAGVKSTNIGGICGYAQNVNSVGNAYLVYNGDIVINQHEKSAEDVYVGGLFGYLAESNKIENLIHNGAIVFNAEVSNNATYYIGGIVGVNKGTLTISDVYAVGDISLFGSYNNGQEEVIFKLNNTENTYVGGIIGQNQNNATFKEDIYSLTCISYMPKLDQNGKNLVFADAVTNNTKELEGLANVQYASNLNLCVSNVKDSNDENSQNKLYKDIITNITNSEDGAEVIEIFGNIKGSKLNPVMFTALNAEPEIEGIYSSSVENDVKVIQGEPTTRRRVFINYNLEGYEIKEPISLTNAVMFSDGGIIYSNYTPFNLINANSAVSGIIAKVKIEKNTYNKYISYAGFANENQGTIFTCSVEEPINYYLNPEFPQTDFYAELKVTTSGNVAGFVSKNSGYIFGSNSNTHISINTNVSSFTVAGFVADNLGIVESSYAHGYASVIDSGQVENLDLFAKNTEVIEDGEAVAEGKVIDCYTIFANQVGAVTNITVSDGCVYEEMGVETGVAKGRNKDVLYNSLPNFSDKAKELFSAENGLNFNYPYLGAGAFAELKYTKKDTKFSKSTTEITDDVDSGSTMAYYEHKEEGDSVMAISTISSLANLTSGEEGNIKDYVLTRNLNLGYLVEVAKEYTWTAPLKDTLSYVKIDGYNKFLRNVNLTGSSLINKIDVNAEISNLNFENVLLNNSNGIINQNYGTIKNVSVTGEVELALATERTIGTLVASNIGKLDFVNLRARISEKVDDTTAGIKNNFSFGGIAGINTGEINSCEIQNTSTSLVLSGHYNI
ncbi:MAG: hypothetical protein IJW25_03525, partial [Clostridia bacterium]|nr:hypothetical protein [Clostridia bacterium]